jgi:transposase
LVAKALLEAHAVLRREFNGLDKRTQKLARAHPSARLLMTTPSVGPIVALTYAAAIDDPKRFRSSKTTGAHFGLTPKKHQSGQKDYTGRISKIGDASVREALYQAAHVMLTKPIKGCSALKSWAMRISKRAACARPRWHWRASSPLSCIGCSLTQNRSTPRLRLRQPKEYQSVLGGPRHQALPSEVPCRDDGSGQAAIREVG